VLVLLLLAGYGTWQLSRARTFQLFGEIVARVMAFETEPANRIAIEKLAGDEGDPVAFAEVLMVGVDDGVTIGSPLVAGATVAGEIVGHRRADQVVGGMDAEMRVRDVRR